VGASSSAMSDVSQLLGFTSCLLIVNGSIHRRIEAVLFYLKKTLGTLKSLVIDFLFW
jgi:hypothetical protein